MKVETELNPMVPASERGLFSCRLILHGRRVCGAKKPRCEDCVLADFCPSSQLPAGAAAPAARWPTGDAARRRARPPRPPRASSPYSADHASGAGCPGRARTAPLAMSRTASGTSACSIGRSCCVDLVGVARARQLDAALQDHRAGVDAAVVLDEVHRDAEDLHAVVERLLDRADAGERRQQRRMDVDDRALEAPQERAREDRHVAGEHDELDVALGHPVGDRRVARRRGPRSRRARRPRSRSRRPARARARPRPAGRPATPTTTTSLPCTRVQQRLQVRPGARGEHADAEGISLGGHRLRGSLGARLGIGGRGRRRARWRGGAARRSRRGRPRARASGTRRRSSAGGRPR